MIQEYLFSSDQFKAEIEAKSFPQKIYKEVRSIENSSCWTLSLGVDSESEEAARLLDPVNTQICEKYRPTVLTNECSGYFNKSLFPLINEFERKLRKLLYLASALQGDSDAHKVISNLEAKDLGEIFEALFSDPNFVKGVKEKVNQKTWQFTSDEILAAIGELKENPLWDSLLGIARVDTLRKRFGEIKSFRNDVMHAHNISLEQYRAAKRLFTKVNEELDAAIGNLIGAKEDNTANTPANFNTTLNSALLSLQSQSDTTGMLETVQVLQDIMKAQPVISPEVIEALSQIEKNASLQIDITPFENALRELAKQMSALKEEIAPSIQEVQSRLSELNKKWQKGDDLANDENNMDRKK